MPRLTDEEYKKALREELTRPRTEETVFHSREGFRKTKGPEHHRPLSTLKRPRRRLGLALMLPLLLIFMMSGNLRGIVIPLLAALALYYLVKRKR